MALVNTSQGDAELGLTTLLEKFTFKWLIEFVDLAYRPAGLGLGNTLKNLLYFLTLLLVNEADACLCEYLIELIQAAHQLDEMVDTQTS